MSLSDGALVAVRIDAIVALEQVDGSTQYTTIVLSSGNLIRVKETIADIEGFVQDYVDEQLAKSKAHLEGLFDPDINND